MITCACRLRRGRRGRGGRSSLCTTTSGRRSPRRAPDPALECRAVDAQARRANDDDLVDGVVRVVRHAGVHQVVRLLGLRVARDLGIGRQRVAEQERDHREGDTSAISHAARVRHGWRALAPVRPRVERSLTGVSIVLRRGRVTLPARDPAARPAWPITSGSSCSTRASSSRSTRRGRSSSPSSAPSASRGLGAARPTGEFARARAEALRRHRPDPHRRSSSTATTASAAARDPADEPDPRPLRDRQRGLPLRALDVRLRADPLERALRLAALIENERLAPFHFWREVGRRMEIQDIPERYEDFERFNLDYEARHFRFAEANRAVGDGDARHVRWLVPAAARAAGAPGDLRAAGRPAAGGLRLPHRRVPCAPPSSGACGHERALVALPAAEPPPPPARPEEDAHVRARVGLWSRLGPPRLASDPRDDPAMSGAWHGWWRCRPRVLPRNA